MVCLIRSKQSLFSQGKAGEGSSQQTRGNKMLGVRILRLEPVHTLYKYLLGAYYVLGSVLDAVLEHRQQSPNT